MSTTSKTLYCPARGELVPAPVKKSGMNSKRRLAGARSRLEPPTKQLRGAAPQRNLGLEGTAPQRYPCLIGLLTSPVPAASGQDAADRDHAHFWPYMTDIYLHRRSIELHYHPRQCLDSQPQVTPGMRALLVEWLTKLHRHFTFQLHTLFLTVNILDRFLATTPVSRDCFQLLGITALLIAAKQEETFFPEIRVLLGLCSDSYTREQVLQLERIMLCRLQFDLLAPTALFFLEHHASERHLAAASAGAGATTHVNRTRAVARYLLELSLQDYSLCQNAPSLLALGCLELGDEVQVVVAGGARCSPRAGTAPCSAGYSRAALLACMDDLRILAQMMLENEPDVERIFETYAVDAVAGDERPLRRQEAATSAQWECSKDDSGFMSS